MVVAEHDGEIALEEAVYRINVQGTERNARLFADDGGDVGHNRNVVAANHAEGHDIAIVAFAAPFRPDNAITEPA